MTIVLIILYILFGLIGLVLLAHLFAYFFVGRTIKSEVKPYLQSSDDVEVTLRPWVVMRPRKTAIKAGIIFHPGGYVDAESYARIFNHVAAAGYLCVLVPGPQRTPMAKRFAADGVMDAFPEINQWYISGHSQGGAVASLYVRDREEKPEYFKKIAGIIFLGFFVFDRHSHAHRSLPCLSVYGSRDGHADKFKPNEKNLPQGAKVVCIEGGNHGQFGAYTFHFGDQTPEIPRHDQQDIAINAIKEFLAEKTAGVN